MSCRKWTAPAIRVTDDRGGRGMGGAGRATPRAAHVTLARTSAAVWCKHPVDYSPPVANSHLTVAGGANGTSYAGGRNDSCTLHQQSLFPPGVELQVLLRNRRARIVGDRSVVVQARSITRGPAPMTSPLGASTVGADVGFTDLANTFSATQMPPDANAGGFAIGAVNGNTDFGLDQRHDGGRDPARDGRQHRERGRDLHRAAADRAVTSATSDRRRACRLRSRRAGSTRRRSR